MSHTSDRVSFDTEIQKSFRILSKKFPFTTSSSNSVRFDSQSKLFLHLTFFKYLMMRLSHLPLVFLLITVTWCQASKICNDPCYKPNFNDHCQPNTLHPNIEAYTLHMTVHPHLDAFWIFDFENYYDPQPSRGDVIGYFQQNRFTSVKNIFNTAMDVLNASKNFREKYGEVHEKARRTFVNSEMGFFKRWYEEQSVERKDTVKQLLKTKYWEILGGGYVENDEACAYYDDIIDNYQLGSHFLQQEFGYFPKVAISADSFGHSQSMAALLSHFGIQAFLVERSDEHILTKSKTEFMWRAKSANGYYYGSIPTHIRWAIHGFEDQFIPGGNIYPVCNTKGNYISNLRMENQFLKRILNQDQIIRYFGHDFQKFDDESYRIIEGMMSEFSKEKCNRVIATYTNPTEYFKILYKEVFEKDVKKMQSREEDIFPIWDYDSGLYWTGYFTTDPYHKKIYRDSGRFLQMARKMFVSTYLGDPKSVANVEHYEMIQRFEQEVAYVQHHDGITATSKYKVLDKVESILGDFMGKLSRSIFDTVFEFQYPTGLGQRIFECYLEQDCVVPESAPDHIYVKVFNSGGLRTEPLRIHLPAGKYYTSDSDSQTVCLCYDTPCNCTLYVYPKFSTFSFIRLEETDAPSPKAYTLEPLKSNPLLSNNNTHIILKINNKQYQIGYKKVVAEATPRNYEHLSRYGTFVRRGFSINSGKYALGNNPNKISDWSTIRDVSVVETPTLSIFVVEWNRPGMKTVLTVNKTQTKTWKVETHSAATSYKLADYFLVVSSDIKNGKVFNTDSNGWLVMKRELFHHEDYEAHFQANHYDDIDGNTYPITAFAYIQDAQDKVSINTDRPQGCIGYKEGSLWVNFDRLSSDDGKWVYENTFRSEYQKFTHWVSVQNTNNQQRIIQKTYDQGVYVQANEVSEISRIQDISEEWKARNEWSALSQIDNIKFNVRAWNDSSLLLRVHNLNDKGNISLTLFAGKTSTFLTSFYGRELVFDSIYETNLLGTMGYQDFLDSKWNWNKVMNTEKQNEIFNKIFAEKIELRPLQLRAFKLINPRFAEKCKQIRDLQYSRQSQTLKLSITKPFVALEKNQLQQDAKNFLLYGDHCDYNSSFDKQQFVPLSEKKAAESTRVDNLNPTDNRSPTPQVQQPKTPIKEPTPTPKPEPTKPVEPAKPIQPVKPAQPSKPEQKPEQKPANPIIKPAQKPISDTKPVNPTKPSNPTSPTNPTKPTPSPQKPKEHLVPGSPAHTTPSTPSQKPHPSRPVKPPHLPVQPQHPTQPHQQPKPQAPKPSPTKPQPPAPKPIETEQDTASPAHTYQELKELVNKGVMLTKQQKQIYFRQRIEELKLHTESCQ